MPNSGQALCVPRKQIPTARNKKRMPVFENYIRYGGNVSLEETHMSLSVLANNVNANETAEGEQAVGFHNVSLYGASQLCVRWSHLSIQGGNRFDGYFSYFGIGNNLSSLQARWIQTNQTALRWFEQAGVESNPPVKEEHCFDVQAFSESTASYAVSVGAYCRCSASEVAKLVVWRISRVMEDGTVKNIYPVRCPAGMHPEHGQVSCSYCPHGTFAADDGLSGCSRCPKGRFQNELGQAECQQCQRGYFQDMTHADSCKPCGAGRLQDKPGQDHCDSCVPGYFQDKEARLMCNRCSKGRYQPYEAQSTCVGEFMEVPDQRPKRVVST
eukprot:gb/GECG01009910.1/.p1 GENE.gb/GECG01009910.1/~~gb/GECG01009910.1/.p1  ORF type:complete len:327 (+),score=21.06 gb/GECG01009910.1/:1-981(+)